MSCFATYKRYRIMTIRYDHGIEDLSPPDIYPAQDIVLSKRQTPPITVYLRMGRLDPGKVFNSSVEYQVLVELMQCNIILQILARDIVRREWPICKPLI